MKRVLISTLGDSPAVVTEAIDILKSKDIEIEEVILMTTKDTDAQESARLLEKHLPSYYPKPLPVKVVTIEDFYDITPGAVEKFMEEAREQLKTQIEAGNEVYVSIAGGRKTKSALMTVAAQIYSPKKLFHIMTKDPEIEEKSKIAFLKRYKPEDQRPFLHPKIEDLIFVEIPFIGLFPWISDMVEAIEKKPQSILEDFKSQERFLADTCALIDYIKEPNALSKEAKECFEKAEKKEAVIFISIVSFFEGLDNLGKPKFPLKNLEVVIRIKEKGNFKIVPLGSSVFEKQEELKKAGKLSGVKSRDLQIVATALVYDAKLITTDAKIEDYGEATGLLKIIK